MTLINAKESKGGMGVASIPSYEQPKDVSEEDVGGREEVYFEIGVSCLIQITINAPNAAAVSKRFSESEQRRKSLPKGILSVAGMQRLTEIGMYLSMLAAKQTTLAAAPREVRDCPLWPDLALRFKGTGYVSGQAGNKKHSGKSTSRGAKRPKAKI